jgi:hypothetical protein
MAEFLKDVEIQKKGASKTVRGGEVLKVGWDPNS